jgi:hypothetical protein
MRIAPGRRAARRQPAVYALPARGTANHPRFDGGARTRTRTEGFQLWGRLDAEIRASRSDQVHRGVRYRGWTWRVPFPWWNRLFGSAYQFLNTGLRQNDTFAFHALAIDEHRKAFAPTLWSNQGATNAAHRPIERTEQRWFIGAHANAGGGYFNDPLPQLPFRWLARKAEGLGLSFSGEFAVDPAAKTAPPTDSYTDFMLGLYRLYTLNRRYYRPIGVPPKSEGDNVVNINETIDASVFERWRTDSSYRPPGLQFWANAKSVDAASIKTTVRADDPSVVVLDPAGGTNSAWRHKASSIRCRRWIHTSSSGAERSENWKIGGGTG